MRLAKLVTIASLAIVLLVGFAWLVLTGGAGCAKVRIRIPSGFRGAFVIRAAPGGTPLVAHGGWYTLNIPETGMLVIDDASFLNCIEVLEAREGDGRPLTTSLAPITPPFRTGLGVYHVATTSEGWYCFLVGSESDVDKARRTGSFHHLGSVDPSLQGAHD